MMKLNGRDILLWGTIAFWLSFWTPGAVYVLGLYYKNRNNQAIRRRHYKIVLIVGIIFIYAFSIDRPIALIDDSNYFPNTSSILHSLHYISFPIQLHGVKLALLWRYFAIYFDMNFVKSMSDSKWKSIISVSYDQNNWFLKHKKTYGNFSWQMKRYLISWLILSILSTIIRNIYQFSAYTESVASILHGIIIFTYAPILIYLCIKLPDINNAYYIKLEIKYITITFISQFIIYLISILLKQFLNVDDFTLQCIWSFSGMVAVSLYLYIFTIWTLRRCVWTVDKNELPSDLNLMVIGGSSLSYNLSNRSKSRFSVSRFSVTTPLEPKPIEMDLFHTLKDSQSYQCFMSHLMNEMSHECLLSFTEMVQFKIAMKQELTNYVRVYGLPVCVGYGTTIKDILLFEFPEIVPISSIVNIDNIKLNKDETNNKKEGVDIIVKQFKQKAHKLFIKYVYDPNRTCEYEINISFSMRNPLILRLKSYQSWMDSNVNERELFCLFDECIIEMYDLMNNSFFRFKETPIYAQLVLKFNV